MEAANAFNSFSELTGKETAAGKAAANACKRRSYSCVSASGGVVTTTTLAPAEFGVVIIITSADTDDNESGVVTTTDDADDADGGVDAYRSDRRGSIID
jgi:hypothetical protein